MPGRRMRVAEGSPVYTVMERLVCGRPRREYIKWAECGGIPAEFARKRRWQIEVWV